VSPPGDRVEEYRARLRRLGDPWDPFLLAESGLPGPTASVTDSPDRRGGEFKALRKGLGLLLARADPAWVAHWLEATSH
jgi:hypothetical protein